MKVKQLIRMLKRAPKEYDVIISAKDNALEIGGIKVMAHTVFITADKTPAEKQKEK